MYCGRKKYVFLNDLHGAKTDVVICSCKVFKKALLEGFPTEIGKIATLFFAKMLMIKKIYFKFLHSHMS